MSLSFAPPTLAASSCHFVILVSNVKRGKERGPARIGKGCQSWPVPLPSNKLPRKIEIPEELGMGRPSSVVAYASSYTSSQAQKDPAHITSKSMF